MLRVKLVERGWKHRRHVNVFSRKLKKFRSHPEASLRTDRMRAVGDLEYWPQFWSRLDVVPIWRLIMADRLFSSFLDFETWNVIHFSISMEPGVPSAILLEMHNLSIPIHWRQGTSPKGLQFSQKNRWWKSCTMFRSTTYQPVLQPSRMVWFVITLHGPPPLPPYCHHDCPMFFVLSPILSQSVCPWVSACGHSEFQAAFREITPISFSDDEVKVPFAADVDWKWEKGSPFMSIHSCFRLVYHLENSLKHPQSNQQLGLTDDMSWQKYSGMMDHGK